MTLAAPTQQDIQTRQSYTKPLPGFPPHQLPMQSIAMPMTTTLTDDPTRRPLTSHPTRQIANLSHLLRTIMSVAPSTTSKKGCEAGLRTMCSPEPLMSTPARPRTIPPVSFNLNPYPLMRDPSTQGPNSTKLRREPTSCAVESQRPFPLAKTPQLPCPTPPAPLYPKPSQPMIEPFIVGPNATISRPRLNRSVFDGRLPSPRLLPLY